MDQLPSHFHQEYSKSPAETFEQKYLLKLQQNYENILLSFSNKQKDGKVQRTEKEQVITQTFKTLSTGLSHHTGFDFGERQKAVLKLKLARHFQQNTSISSSLFDAIIESPKFLATDKGTLTRLLEVHEEKTVQKIAEIRRRKAEQTGEQRVNPYEALFTTVSGNYYLARLLNMPHLEEESTYIKHCVGTTDSYINKMKRGEIEILSLRHMPTIDPHTGQRSEDPPVMTIEYHPQTGVIEQMKKKDDEHLTPEDPFYPDVIDALKQLRLTHNDIGKIRDIRKIAPSELEQIPVTDGSLLTDHGEITLHDFNPKEDVFVLKIGKMDIGPHTPKQDTVKLLKLIDQIEVSPEQLSYSPDEITPQTRVYLGPIVKTRKNQETGEEELIPEYKDLFQRLPETLEHIYTSFPEGRIRREHIEIGGKDERELKNLLERNGHRFDYVEWMLEHDDFKRSLREADPKQLDWKKWKLKSLEEAKLVRLRVEDLGFSSGATTDQIYARAEELGLELCPPEVGPQFRLQYVNQPMNKYVYVGMKQISGSGGDERVFSVERYGGGSWLSSLWAEPMHEWMAHSQFLFRLRKKL